MVQKRLKSWAAWLGAGLLAAGVAGCRVHVDKNGNGDDKSVQVDTPFGGVHVNTDQTTAADVGLPVYPGAETVKADDQHKSADVDLGFGAWQLRVRAVSYGSRDSQEQVLAFYKKSMAKYGDVLTCRNHAPVGSPRVTGEGLTCEDSEKGAKINVNGSKNGIGDSSELQLRAGSKHHQHIVGFEEPKDGQTRFALVALDLPATGDKEGKSD